MNLTWAPPSAAPQLPTGTTVHVWSIDLDKPASVTSELRALLSADERVRADRFRFHRDRSRFNVARGVLRRRLGSYLGIPPDQLRFEYDAYGKPRLAGPPEATSLHFNVSHAEGVAIFGFTIGRQIGVDIERVRRMPELQEVAGRYFSASEVRTLATVPEDQQDLAFFTCWTRKEAYVKAVGAGLSLALDSFDVSFVAGLPAMILRAVQPREAERWSLHALSPHPEYVAALVVEGVACPVRCWRYADFPE